MNDPVKHIDQNLRFFKYMPILFYSDSVNNLLESVNIYGLSILNYLVSLSNINVPNTLNTPLALTPNSFSLIPILIPLKLKSLVRNYVNVNVPNVLIIVPYNNVR